MGKFRWGKVLQGAKKMKELKRNHNKQRNPHWNGGRFKDCRGYVFILVGDKYIGEHRLAVENQL